MAKTTLMTTAMGFLKPWRGAIEFDGHDLTRLTPHEIARLGIGLVPESRRIFPGLTVRENLELGLSAVANRSAALRRRRFEEVFHHFPRLSERLDRKSTRLNSSHLVISYAVFCLKKKKKKDKRHKVYAQKEEMDEN